MKAISIWRAYAHLIVHNHKFTETRGWPAPKSLIRQRIAIAATKIIRPEERAAFAEPEFQRHWRETGLPLELDELAGGCVLGFANLHSCDVITEEDLEDVTEQELAFGWWTPGRYAWRLRHPEPCEEPIPARGAQGVWDWNAYEPLVRSFRIVEGHLDRSG